MKMNELKLNNQKKNHYFHFYCIFKQVVKFSKDAMHRGQFG